MSFTSGQRLLITGGTGFFGRSLIRRLAELPAHTRPQTVAIITRDSVGFEDRHPEFKIHQWLQYHQGNVLKSESLPLLSGFTHLIHAAADSTPPAGMTNWLRFDQIVEGTRNVLTWAATLGIRRVLNVSSGAVYGRMPEHMTHFREEDSCAADSLRSSDAYGVAKRTAEHLGALASARWGLEVMCARCFAFVGRDLPLDAHFAIGNFIRDALGGAPIQVLGDGKAVRSYLDQRDLADWLLTILLRGEPGHAYNVGSDESIEIIDLAHTVRRLLAPGASVVMNATKESHTGSNRYVPSVEKAKRELGLRATYSLDEAILETARRSPSQ